MEATRVSFSELSEAVAAASSKRAEAEAEGQRIALDIAKLEARLEAALAAAGTEDPASKAAEARARRDVVASERGRLEAVASAWAADLQRAEARSLELSARVADLAKRLEDARSKEALALAEAGFKDTEAVFAARLNPLELSSLEAEAAAYRSGFDAARATVQAIAAEMEASGGTFAPGVEDKEEVLAAAVGSARAERDRLQADLDAAVASVSDLARERDKRASLVAERARLDAAWSRLGGLSALLCGELPGRRLPFKNYVLASYFRVVVERASAQLARMSDGRYALAADEGGGRGYVGLEILVRDAQTGQSRPAGTLSGGERFMAALSLALGLADTIRERSGGTSLDAIFIDEGFGSLDDEALDRAVSVLDEARGARTIGIVSHLAELKARIPSRIEVSKGRSGSSLRIVS
jgi:exonuclease SbcC